MLWSTRLSAKPKHLYDMTVPTVANAVTFTDPSFWYTNASVAAMRQGPAHDTPIVSSTYYSEEITPLETRADWVYIRTIIDNYSGWIPKNSLISRQTAYTNVATSARVDRLFAHVYDREDTEYGPITSLPFDSRVKVIESQSSPTSRWLKIALLDDKIAYIQRGDITFSFTPRTIKEMCDLSEKFLGLPYTWGGRSAMMGYDCSGFVQMLYRQMGIYLPRDSKDQIKWEGFQETSFDTLSPGDLLFFGTASDAIRHVGLFLGHNTFIHATKAENQPYIRKSYVFDPAWSGTLSAEYSFRSARTLKHK